MYRIFQTFANRIRQFPYCKRTTTVTAAVTAAALATVERKEKIYAEPAPRFASRAGSRATPPYCSECQGYGYHQLGEVSEPCPACLPYPGRQCHHLHCRH